MKILATIALLLVAGCASKPKPIKQPTSVLLPSSVEGVGDEPHAGIGHVTVTGIDRFGKRHDPPSGDAK